ncbi:MAG: T9SS type A sorting domain-containing protein [Weeksellaceae bacterium]|jgi:hypothetical protein|nr:T9SS type A sorting domain-containing protein [Weeksellaceae bacterium]
MIRNSVSVSRGVQLFDFSGKLIIHKKLELYEEQHFDYSDLVKSGTYLLKLKSENSKTVKTFKLLVR